MIDRTNFDDCMDVLAQAHNWRLSPAALDAFYVQISRADQDDFDQSYRAALGFTDYYTPAKFVGALRTAIVEQSRTAVPRALKAAKYEPCPEGLMKLAKHMRHLGDLKRAGADWNILSQHDLTGHLKECFATPLTDDEMLAAEGKTVSGILADGFGAPQKPSEGDWGDYVA